MKRDVGYLEVIAGPMYCGKTEELIRLMKRAAIAKKKLQVFKHSIDTRYGIEPTLYSHAGITFACETIQTAKELLKKLKPSTQIVALDEAQWFDEELIDVVNKLLDKRLHVYIAGLAMTFDREPFLPMPTLMAMADRVTKLSAICSLCGNDAVFHKRLVSGDTVSAQVADPAFVSKFDESVFQARCRRCFKKK